jgi:H2-forming N5,N10-methylenetetrahydromethanopterin dehydrogenase-like enzyme
LKGVELDSSRRVELEDYIDVGGHSQHNSSPPGLPNQCLYITAGFATPLRTYPWCTGGL